MIISGAHARVMLLSQRLVVDAPPNVEWQCSGCNLRPLVLGQLATELLLECHWVVPNGEQLVVLSPISVWRVSGGIRQGTDHQTTQYLCGRTTLPLTLPTMSRPVSARSGPDVADFRPADYDARALSQVDGKVGSFGILNGSVRGFARFPRLPSNNCGSNRRYEYQEAGISVLLRGHSYFALSIGCLLLKFCGALGWSRHRDRQRLR